MGKIEGSGDLGEKLVELVQAKKIENDVAPSESANSNNSAPEKKESS